MELDLSLLLFWLKKLVAVAVLPPVLPLMLIVPGLLLLRRHRRVGSALAWTGVALNLALITPLTVGWLVDALEPAPTLSVDAARRAQAIVVLGAGKRTYAPEFGGETVNRLSLERVRYGARLARQTGLPVLVSGGAPTGDLPEAELMKAALEQDFGIPVRWMETASRDTRQNAQFSAVQLQAAGIERILLVTHAAHMARARTEFEARGLDVIPAPTAWLGGGEAGDRVLTLLPSQNTAYAGWFALHEWLGLVAYRLSR